VVFRIAGQPIRSSAAVRSAAELTAAQGAGRPPTFSTKLFSAIRSCATRSAAGAGWTGSRSASHSTGVTSTFSNS